MTAPKGAGGGFTPGPWDVWHDQVFAGPFKKIPGGIRGFRAKICEMDDLDLDKEEVEANARLIAAAPELLEALRLCARLVDLDSRLLTTNAEHPTLGGYVRAALAKAGGSHV